MNLINDDCLNALKLMPGSSVDSIVTDPPYGLSFMGKKWDYDVPSKEIWTEALRVLKPGGHLLSFAGTRTYHRMAVNIEDAGFEIRDQIMWIYASGFPKSTDVSKRIDKEAGAEREVIGYKSGVGGENINQLSREGAGDSEDAKGCGAYGKGAKQVAIEIPVTAPATDAAKQWQGWGTALKPANEIVCLARKPLTSVDELTMLVRELCQSQLFANVAEKILKLNQNESSEALNIAQWIAGESPLTQDALFALMDMSQSESAKSLNLSIEYSWLNILAEILVRESTFTIETASSLITDLKILRSLLSKITQESIIQAETNQHGQPCNVLLARNLFFAVSTKLSFIQTPSVLESVTSTDIALSPNSSPIVVARKPLEKGLTVAQNVLKYGTGALNIDGSRVKAADQDKLAKNWDRETQKNISGVGTASGEGINSGILNTYSAPQGRWPANILFDEEAAAVLGEPSRFFYIAKASKKERNAGLEGMPIKPMNTYNFSEDGSFTENHTAKSGKSERQDRQNHHPTVKPIKLMEYLIKLVTPPNGTCLDPFMGSGSTGVAAKNLGFNFIGIERELEYFEISKRRIGE